jgi:hypothetical protein
MDDLFLKDLIAFIFIAKDDKFLTDAQILANVCHDLSGTIKKEECFVPRSSGYHQLFKGRVISDKV